jgi:hypothetical protein
VTERDWLVEGAEVVEVDLKRRTVGIPTMGIPTTVERIGSREVRCADGRRYSVTSLMPVGAGAWVRRTLVSVSDPRVAEVRREQGRHDALQGLILAVDALHESTLTAEALDGVQAALDRCRELLVDTEPDRATR